MSSHLFLATFQKAAKQFDIFEANFRGETLRRLRNASKLPDWSGVCLRFFGHTQCMEAKSLRKESQAA